MKFLGKKERGNNFQLEAVTKAFAKVTNQNEGSCENIIDTYNNLIKYLL